MTSFTPELDLPPDHLLRRILDALTAHPEVREPLLRALLTEDFLALPGQVQELREDFEGLREETRTQFREVNRRLDENTQRLDENAQRLDENTRAIRRLEGHVGRLVGNSYEDLCRSHISVILDGFLNRPVLADREQINGRLREARWNGEISRTDYLHGLSPDIIAREDNDGGHDGRLAIVEASITFNRDDIDNAAHRAGVIGKVTGAQSDAFVVTQRAWPEEVSEVAGRLGVTIIRHEVPEFAETQEWI